MFGKKGLRWTDVGEVSSFTVSQNAARLPEIGADPVGSLKNVRLTFLMNVAEAVLL
jgi:hypothetical protein